MFPAFEHRKELLHSGYRFLVRVGLSILALHLIVELSAELDHFLHRAIGSEFPFFVTIDAVIPSRGSVGFRAEVIGLLHRRTATLAK